MPGRPDFSQPGTQGGGQTVAVQNRPSPDTIVLDSSTSISSGGSEIKEVYAPTGSVYEIMGLRLYCKADPDWTSGSHEFIVRHGGGENVQIVAGESDYTSSIDFNLFQWVSATNSKYPPVGEVGTALGMARATDSVPIQVEYKNDADLAQDQSRDIVLKVNEVSY